MMKIKSVNRKSLKIRKSDRSSNFITPSFGFGCLYKCLYCYMRRHVKDGLTIAKNTDEILQAIDDHVQSLPWPKKPDQTHEKYYTYDFSCNEDYFLHLKYHDWDTLLEFFKNHPKAFGTAATKYVNYNLLDYNPEKKIRIRFSLMPQVFSDLLEPNTSKIIDRIKAINLFYDAGYDVHINYSPIIASPKSKELYTELFGLVDKHIRDEIKPTVKAECIFLTHNEKMHQHNETNNCAGEELLWQPKWQESKTSEYGGKNIRYKWQMKNAMRNRFLNLMQTIVPWQEVRYIF
jgi:spore photoproduct lyase